MLSRPRYGDSAAALFDRLWSLENETALDWIGL
jgi:hypothetical protein